jgi:hypothetical protein
MKKFITIILLSIYAFSLTVSDIEVMRKDNVLIAFPNERKAHTIPRNITPSELMRVNYIRLNNQPLYFVPSWLPKMTNLVRLELKNTKLNLKELSKLKTLTKLNTLDISDNPLFKKGGSLVDFLSAFSLSELYLSNTGGGNSDYNNIGSLGSLIKLDLSDNSISDIYDLNLQKLTRLKELSLANNNIGGTLDTSYLPKESLVKLDLSGNKISKFGFSGDFPALITLNISNNQTYMEFAEEYNNPYLFPNLKSGSFNKDINLPESIMRRLGIREELERLAKEIKDKFITPSNSTCKANGGKLYKGVCQATWEDAQKICRASGGKLPSREDFHKVIKACGGIADANNRDEWDKNKNNSRYQKCYKQNGFSDEDWYWTSKENDSSVVWYVSFNDGNDNCFHRSSQDYVRCVR